MAQTVREILESVFVENNKPKLHDKKVYYTFKLAKSWGLYQAAMQLKAGSQVDVSRRKLMKVLSEIKIRLGIDTLEIAREIANKRELKKEDILKINQMVMDIIEDIINS